MDSARPARVVGRLLGALVLAIALAGLPLPSSVAEHGVAAAEERIDVGLANLAFSALPLSVEPAATFEIGVEAAPGVTCSGEVAFREQPPIALDPVAADGGTCRWSVTVPPAARPGSARIAVEVARSGQLGRLYGVVYVNPLGESR